MVTISERALSTTVNAIDISNRNRFRDSVSSRFIFSPVPDLGASMAQDQSVAETILHQMPAVNRTAADHLLQRRGRARRSTQRVQRYSFRTAALRLRLQFHPSPAFQPFGFSRSHWGVERTVMVN